MRSAARAGSAAIEFAFIAPVFFVLLMGSIEVGVMFFGQFRAAERHQRRRQARAHRTDHARCRTRSCQAQLNAWRAKPTQAQFRTYICNEISPGARLRQQSADRRGGLLELLGGELSPARSPAQHAQSRSQQFRAGRRVQRGAAADLLHLVVVTPLLTPFMTNMANNKHLLSATAAFRNEPYTTGSIGMLKTFFRMLKAREGLAAVEFAFVAPVMIVMFFGAVELSAAVDCKTRVTNRRLDRRRSGGAGDDRSVPPTCPTSSPRSTRSSIPISSTPPTSGLPTPSAARLERLFTLMFQGFVYNQIWEDPDVDLQALDLKPHHRLITIASGGCNVLNYLAADPAKIIAVDLNPNHIALTG
jgi:hypothetical protein